MAQAATSTYSSWMPLSANPAAERRSLDVLKHERDDRRMSIDYATNGNPLFNNDLDLASLNNGDHQHSSSHLPLSAHGLDRADSLDLPDHPPYDLFSSSSSGSLASNRYRTNGSSSSSLGHNYALAVDPLYPPSSFQDSLPPFHGSGGGPYDLIGGLPSSYSSGKPSPLTPNDLPHNPAFPFSSQHPKDYPHPAYHDALLDRRLPPGPASYNSDYNDDFAGIGVNPALGLNAFHPPNGLHGFGDRLPRLPGDGRYGSNGAASLAVLPHLPDPARAAGQAAHAFRGDGALSGPFDDMPQFMSPNPQVDYPLRMSVDENMARLRLQGAGDLQTFIRPYLDQYVRTPNRLAFGERTVIVMSSKVAQKSYGTEKRFLCPPPTAIMIGNSWWSDVHRRGEEPKLCPPRVVISISGEPVPQEGSIEWTSATGKGFDVADPPTGTTYIGRCVGKQLFISDVDEKKKKVEALVKIVAPGGDDEPERVVGTFPSRPIKVISKPSKKRQSAKNLELCINHGSTISLFHRLRSQTVSTKYLCVSGSGSSFKGSDGAPLLGLDQRARTQTPSFIARTASWDPFIMYIVDVNKPAGGMDTPPPPPPQADFPSPPPNAIPFTNNGSQIPIYYNQTVVLQCLTSGVVSPVLVIRKVDHQTTVVGGGLQEGAKGIADHYCCPGEVCGDPVSQLHKIAFEVYDPARGAPEPGTPGATGAFLSCMGEKVNTYRPVEGRQWNTAVAAAAAAAAAATAGRDADSPTGAPGSPTVSTPTSTSGSADYFHGSGASASSVPTSPDPADFPSNDGGRVKKEKGKRGSSSTGALGVGGALAKGGSSKGRRRPTSAGSAGSSGRRGAGSDAAASSGALWQVDIGETSVWTIVGVDQVRYNFYVPPVLFDAAGGHAAGHAGGAGGCAFPVPAKPVTPFPGVVKYLPPDRASEAPKACPNARANGGTAPAAKPSPHASKMLTVYGENFSKTEPVTVFFGSDPSPYVEVRCTEVLGCLPPEGGPGNVGSNGMGGGGGKRRPIVLVRGDGVVFPSNTYYP
ncbi:hypothetical protein EIP86_003374 [Pleurotus ostreatoroseus]|nr:hypothetical protein EIP86_003374 [Pleurotus ostreatoroseus]